MQSPEVYVIVAEQLQPGFAGGFHQKLSHNFGLAILGAAWQHYQAKIPGKKKFIVGEAQVMMTAMQLPLCSFEPASRGFQRLFTNNPFGTSDNHCHQPLDGTH